jgi:hypothetical protein
MPQKLLPFKYVESKKSKSMTNFSGLLPYVELLHQMNFFELARRHVQVHSGDQGWLDSQALVNLMLLNLSGGSCVEDIERLEQDKGLCKAIRYLEKNLICIEEFQNLDKRFRNSKGRKRCFASANALRGYMEKFHNEEAELDRLVGTAYIPESTAALEGLYSLNEEFLDFMQLNNIEEEATIDGDAVLVESDKSEALYCYKKFKSYQPLNMYWFEQRMVVRSEFRDGNVPAGHQIQRVFSESLDMLPERVKRVRFRSDSAGYQYELMDYCEKGEHSHFGRIEFAISCDISEGFKRSVVDVKPEEWKDIYRDIGSGIKIKTGQQWAELDYVGSINSPDYRYIAIRERKEYQRCLPGFGEPVLPFPHYEEYSVRYKLSGLVTNMDWCGEELIHWSRKRCGLGEQVHSLMKSDFCGGKLPSGKFGANACWWQAMILALNLNEILKRLTLPLEWVKRRMKSLRYWFINVAGRVEKGARQLRVILDHGQKAFELYLSCRERIAVLKPLPGG